MKEGERWGKSAGSRGRGASAAGQRVEGGGHGGPKSQELEAGGRVGSARGGRVGSGALLGAPPHARIHGPRAGGRTERGGPVGALAWGLGPGGSWAALPAGGPRPAADAPATAAPGGTPGLPPLLHLPDLPCHQL